jgi:hypothetical protein
MNRHLLVLAAAALLGACAGSDSKPTARKDPPYVFPHTPHIEGDVDCKVCHGAILKNARLEARVRHVALPKKNQDPCNGCHDDKEFKAKTTKMVIPARTREFEVRMNHAAHLAKSGVKCQQCHQAPPEAGQTRPSRISMSVCTSCHKHQLDYAQARCTPCHVDLKPYDKPVETFRHQGDFLKLHGDQARPTAESCAQCHDQTFCADCHSGTAAPARQAILFPEEVQRDFIHRGDYQSRHQVEAGANPASCRKCHGSQFCNECHTLRNFAERSSVQPTNPHPASWGIKGSGDFHGFAARKNIVLCAGCHDNGADAVCVRCHSAKVVGPNGVFNNPHPSSWKRKASDEAKTPMCLVCH